MAVCVMGSMPVVQKNISPVVSMAESSKEEYTYENLTYDFLEDGTIEITGCDKSATEVVIPSEINGVLVTSIGESAFYMCQSLESVIMPDSLTSIGGGVFVYCDNLTSVNIPDSVTSIEYNSFICCKNLKSIKIPDSVTNIGYNAFLECSNLTEITIPNSVTNIGCKVFANCESLTEITILNPDCEIDDVDYMPTISNSINYDNVTETWESYFNGTIYGYENSTAQAYAEKYGYKFESLGKAPEKTGDLNGDNEFNISDVLTLQKYLLGGSDTEITDWKQADLNSDGVLDVFDLVLMRKKLIEK